MLKANCNFLRIKNNGELNVLRNITQLKSKVFPFFLFLTTSLLQFFSLIVFHLLF